MRYKHSKEVLQEVVFTSKSIAEVCRKLDIVPAGGNYKTLKNKFIQFEIDTSHFTGKGWNVGLKFQPKPAKSLEEILQPNTTYPTFKLKNRLLREGVKKYYCEQCSRKTWLKKPIPLELHHTNGDIFDNRLDNLQLLCPNCHALTPNHRGKNKGRLNRNV